MHWQFGEMKFGEMKRNTSNWSNFGMLLRRAGLTALAGLSCFHCGPFSEADVCKTAKNDIFQIQDLSLVFHAPCSYLPP